MTDPKPVEPGPLPLGHEFVPMFEDDRWCDRGQCRQPLAAHKPAEPLITDHEFVSGVGGVGDLCCYSHGAYLCVRPKAVHQPAERPEPKTITRLGCGCHSCQLADANRLAEDSAAHGCACDWEVGQPGEKTTPPDLECLYHSRLREGLADANQRAEQLRKFIEVLSEPSPKVTK